MQQQCWMADAGVLTPTPAIQNCIVHRLLPPLSRAGRAAWVKARAFAFTHLDTTPSKFCWAPVLGTDKHAPKLSVLSGRLSVGCVSHSDCRC